MCGWTTHDFIGVSGISPVTVTDVGKLFKRHVSDLTIGPSVGDSLDRAVTGNSVESLHANHVRSGGVACIIDLQITSTGLDDLCPPLQHIAKLVCRRAVLN